MSSEKPQESKKSSHRLPIAAGLLVGAIAAGGFGLSLSANNKDTKNLRPDPRSKDRITIATQPYNNPSIEKVVTVGETKEKLLGRPARVRERVLVTLSLPENKATEKLRKKYASNDDKKSISWLVPFNVQTTEIANIKGKDTPRYIGFVPSVDKYYDGPPISKHGGETTVEFLPIKASKNGTKVALFAEVQALDTEKGNEKFTNGFQYIGAIVRQNDQWQIAQNQAPLENFSSTTSTPQH